LAADASNLVATMGLRREWPNIAAISLAHSYGFSNLVLPLLLHGIPLILLRSALPERMRCAQNAAMPGPYTLAGVPTLWRAWLAAKALTVEIRIAISAGAPLPLKLEQQAWTDFGVRIHNFLGASECGGIAFDPGDEPRVDPNLAGLAMRGVDLSVKDGMLEVRGTAVGQSYWPYPEEGLENGVFQTKDLVEIRDGKLFLFGRANDVINVAGLKVAPEEIERAIGQHPGVKECLVFEGPRIYDDTQIIAVVVGTANAHELRKFAEGKIPRWQVPREWHFVESLGHNERGKVSRVQWRERLFNSRKE
jgi:acyl-coenzyme A synthetase/AMP-(fatty) acid ligase